MSEALGCLDREICIAACAACPNYGTSWSCPPFDIYRFRALHPEQYMTLRLVVTQFESHRPMRLDEAYSRFRIEAMSIMPELRNLARQHGGVTYGFACSCDLCREGCSRPLGQPCRHPEEAGPSLEAAGFDVGMLLQKFIPNVRLEWSNDGFAPRVTTYVAAVAY